MLAALRPSTVDVCCRARQYPALANDSAKNSTSHFDGKLFDEDNGS
jgi:hypothetical protein